MLVTRLGFVFMWSLTFFTIIALTAIYGVSVINDPNIQFSVPPVPSILDILFFPLQATAIFIQLMTVSSEFFLVGTAIIPAFLIGMLWAIAELLRGSGG